MALAQAGSLPGFERPLNMHPLAAAPCRSPTVLECLAQHLPPASGLQVRGHQLYWRVPELRHAGHNAVREAADVQDLKGGRSALL